MLAVEGALVGCGAVMLLAALLVLHGHHRADVSLRALAALLIGAYGAMSIAKGLSSNVELTDVVGPLGIVMWIAQALWKRRGHQMRRDSDWSALDTRSEGTS